MTGSIADAKSFAPSLSAPNASVLQASNAKSAMMQRKIGNPCHIPVFEYHNKSGATRNILEG
ncbi:hypothetical protein [Bradyrhizobium guangdongense]|uniref:hypothetical protein n=1 Tax=Bradyrhizobium guangdongense TaxID=1325090 RepID=UPI001FD290A8|nr:hypothetical protein [Bradyrhizobium guangdongense]